MSIINTNVMSLNSQRNLATNNASLGTTIQRLSSGLRINSAKDDAAGLAISERFSTQIRGMNQAARNANDGISLAQTAEGALAEIGNNLQRIRELSVQSRNATNSADDRKALDAEAQLLKAEVQRVAEQASFNGTKLLDGSFMNQAFQVGADQGQIINIAQLANANTSQLGNWTSVATSASLTGVAATGTGGTAGTASVTGTAPTGTVTPGATTNGTGALTTANFAAPVDTNGDATQFDYAGFNISVNGGANIAVAAATGATEAAARTDLLAKINTALAGASIADLTIDSSVAGTLSFSNAGATALTISGPAAFGADVSITGATTGASTTAYAALNAGDITINGQSVGAVAGGQANAGARGAAIAAAINALNTGATPTGVTAAADANGLLTLTSASAIQVGGSQAAAAGLTAGPTPVTGGASSTFGALSGDALTINGVNIEVTASSNAAQRASALVKAINTAAGSNTALSGVSASLVGGNLQIRSSTGDVVVGGTSSDLTALTGLTAGTTAGGALAGSTAHAVGTDQVGFSSLSIASAEGADNAILAMDAALTAVNNARADLGAIQNRFSSVISNLNTTSENLSASRSRIRDTDFAKETAELTRTQILNQAGTAMLAQANQVPQSVLSLLR